MLQPLKFTVLSITIMKSFFYKEALRTIDIIILFQLKLKIYLQHSLSYNKYANKNFKSTKSPSKCFSSFFYPWSKRQRNSVSASGSCERGMNYIHVYIYVYIEAEHSCKRGSRDFKCRLTSCFVCCLDIVSMTVPSPPTNPFNGSFSRTQCY